MCSVFDKFYYLCIPKKQKKLEEKKERIVKVIHLEVDGRHTYYGSLKALCDNNSKDVIGITYSSLRCVELSTEKPYRNKKCTIRKGALVTSSAKKE